MICIANYFCQYSITTQQWKLFSSVFRNHPEISLSVFRNRRSLAISLYCAKSEVLLKAYSKCRIQKCLCTEIYGHRIVYVRHNTEFCLALPLSSASKSKNLCTVFRNRVAYSVTG